MTKQKMRVGIIGGGLMGREAASAFGRWFALNDFPVQVELTAVCDLQEKLLDWFRQVPTVKLLTKDHTELLKSPEVDVVYVAVPHNLHEKLYLDVLNAGKDLLAEKPFGIDLRAALAIYEAAKRSGKFVRCSSEFPFLPGPQRVIEASYHAAYAEAVSPGSLSVSGSAASRVKRERVEGAVEVEYQAGSSEFSAATLTPIFTAVEGLLAPLLIQAVPGALVV